MDLWFLPNYEFEVGLDYEGTVKFAAEVPGQSHDAFIAAFRTDQFVTVPENPVEPSSLSVTPLPVAGQWSIRFPHAGDWTIRVHNAAGQALGTRRAKGTTMVLDLRDQAPGLYLLKAIGPAGALRWAKVMRP